MDKTKCSIGETVCLLLHLPSLRLNHVAPGIILLQLSLVNGHEEIMFTGLKKKKTKPKKKRDRL